MESQHWNTCQEIPSHRLNQYNPAQYQLLPSLTEDRINITQTYQFKKIPIPNNGEKTERNII